MDSDVYEGFFKKVVLGVIIALVVALVIVLATGILIGGYIANV